LFISNSDVFTTAAASITKIVVLEQTSSLPKIDSQTYAKIVQALMNSTITLSNTIRNSEPGSLLKSIFNGVPDIDMAKVKIIDLDVFGAKIDGDTIYKMKFGPYVKDSIYQSVNDEILSIINKEKVHEGDADKLIIKRKLTISYYNKDGLFAQGSVIYAILQEKPTN
jgi:hypothetical protein